MNVNFEAIEKAWFKTKKNKPSTIKGLDELEKIFKDYGTKEDIVGYSMYYISGETIINILNKIQELKKENENDK